MRITLRSIKSVPSSFPPQTEQHFTEKCNYPTENSEPHIDVIMRRHVNNNDESKVELSENYPPKIASIPSRSSSDSGIESPVRPIMNERPKQPTPDETNKSNLKSPAKNIVVSSFNTPSPKRPVYPKESMFFNNSEQGGSKSMEGEETSVNGLDDIMGDHSDYSYKKEFMRNNKITATNIPDVEYFDEHDFEKTIDDCSELHDAVFLDELETNTHNDKTIKNSSSHKDERGLSKIPRKVSITSIKKSEDEDKRKKPSLKQRAITAIPMPTVLRRTPKRPVGVNKVKLTTSNVNKTVAGKSKNVVKVSKKSSASQITGQKEEHRDKPEVEPGKLYFIIFV